MSLESQSDLETAMDSPMAAADTLRSVHDNEKGLQCFCQERYEDAIEHFGFALRTLNQVLSSQSFVEEDAPQGQTADQDMPDDQDMEDRDPDDTSIVEAPPSSCHCTIPQEHKSLQGGLGGHNALIYKAPISISKMTGQRDSHTPSYTTVVEMSISVIFNFALAHHLFAVSGQTQDEARVLDQAVALYELTHSLQLQEGIELSLEYTMATVCNLGHIHNLRGDTDKATKCFQHLLSIFCFLQSQSTVQLDTESSVAASPSSPGRKSSSQETSLQKLVNTDAFYHSVSHLLLSEGAAAAA